MGFWASVLLVQTATLWLESITAPHRPRPRRSTSDACFLSVRTQNGCTAISFPKNFLLFAWPLHEHTSRFICFGRRLCRLPRPLWFRYKLLTLHTAMCVSVCVRVFVCTNVSILHHIDVSMAGAECRDRSLNANARSRRHIHMMEFFSSSRLVRIMFCVRMCACCKATYPC